MTVALATASAWYGRNPFFSYDPTVGMLPFHESTHGRRLLRAPNQCLAAETEIATPTGQVRIGDIAPGVMLRVLASGPDGVQEVAAFKGDVRPAEPLYRVETRQGRSFLATARHRVLTLSGWVTVAQVRRGSALALPSLTDEPVGDVTTWSADIVVRVSEERRAEHHDLRVPWFDNFLGADGLVHHNCGKTIACAWEAWAHLLGLDRFKGDRSPADGMAMIADLDNAYPVISDKLREVAPLDLLDPATRFIAGKGWYTNGARFIRTKAGNRLIFRGGEGSPMSAESATVGFLWIDEPPKQDRFGGAVSRVAVRSGPVFMGFTPVSRPVGWLRVRVEGDAETGTPPREEWQQFRPRLTEADCTTIGGRVIRSQASIDRQTAGYDEWELAQRVYGEWEGVAVERKLRGFGAGCVITDAELPDEYDTDSGDELRIGMDHGEGTGKQMVYLLLCKGPRVWVIDEWSGPKSSGPRDVALAIRDQLRNRGLTIYHVRKIVGDINSAGFLGGGGKYNAFIERELMDVLKLSSLPVDVSVPNKGRGSVGAGEVAMSHAMREGRFFVTERCTRFIASAKAYTGREEDLKDPIDAVRYGCADWLLRYGASTSSVQVLTL